ncbi:MAG TPA: histidine kinase dimerization/phospho-acceptor domain-containing protein, partial [Acidimicrobiia bacterium]|nr:histidine kinase dimerization/phospho-acceptor domain-containing protein [Acidimicrobiia bacterium]
STLERASAETATHRASLVIAFAAAGMDQADLATKAAAESMRAVERIVGLLGALEVPREALVASAENLLSSTIEVGDQLQAGRAELARDLVEDATLPEVEALAQALAAEAGIMSSRIAGERSEAGSLARTASFVVALVVPAMTVVGFRRVTKRRIERERLEAELSRQRELSQAKDHLIAGLSHQLRTPITGIYGFADVLLTYPDPELLEEGLATILEESGNLRRMVDDILVTARIDAENLGYNPVGTAVTAIVDHTLSHFVRLGASIKVDCEPCLINVDASRLEHALRNLVANAIGHGAEPIHVVGRVAGDAYRLAVCDAGPGLGSESEADPFRAFANDPDSVTIRGSLGLGLSVARTLIEAMAGTIEHTRVDGTTVFAMTLPKAVDPGG